MSNYLDNSLLSIACFMAAMAFYQLISSGSSRAPANKLLAFWLSIFGILMGMLYLAQSEFILYVPWLYRVPSPLYYMAFPAGYLYARMLLNAEQKLHWWDYLHFFPGLLHCIELLPFYFLPSADKLAIIKEDIQTQLGLIAHREGILPPFAHNLIRGVQSLIYSLLIVKVLSSHQTQSNQRSAHQSLIYKWLYAIAAIQLIYSVILIMIYPNQGIEASLRLTIIYAVFSASFIYVAVKLVRNPSILIGMPYPTLESTAEQPKLEQIEKPQRQKNHAEEWKEELEQVLHYFETAQPYLQQEYRLSNLAKDVNIPNHQLSYIFNHVLNKRFSDYINERRIEYLKVLTQNEKSDNYTLEALAMQAGFGSRSSFIRVTGKLTGENPSAYFKK